MSHPYGVGSGQISPAELGARIIDAAGKGQVALLVTDAAGVVVVGIKATGGLTELRYDGEGRWLFAGALSGRPEILDGSYALRNQLGTEADQAPDDFDHEPGDILTPEEAHAAAQRQLERHRLRRLAPAPPQPEPADPGVPGKGPT